MSASKSGELLTTVSKAMAVVELVAAESSLTLTQISQRLDIGMTATHRLVHTLASNGWLNRDEYLTYSLGSKMFRIMSSMNATFDATERIRPILIDLWEQTGETIHLTSLDGRFVTYLDQIISPRPVHSASTVGGRSPAHCVSPGLSQIAAHDDDYLDWFLSQKLPKYTVNTTTSPERFRGLIVSIREAGYAVNLGGYREDVGGVSVAVIRPDGKPIVGLSVCAPVYRLESSDKAGIGELLVHAAGKVQEIFQAESISTFM